jgi:hypothetical protein
MMKVLAVAVGLLAASCNGALGPPATPFAPEDLSFTLPREVNGLILEVETQTADEISQQLLAGESLRRALVDRGTEPSDVLAATATGSELNEGEEYRYVGITAVRVRGIIADELSGMVIPMASGVTVWEPRIVGAKSVRQLGEDVSRDSIIYMYPRGEVLYLVLVTSETDGAAALEALP